jgi:thioredoxin 1
MAPRIILAVAVGGGIGLLIGTFGKAMGGQCPIACNPYISTALGVVLALVLASRGEASASMPGSEAVLSLDSQAAYEEAISGPGQVTLVEFYTTYCPACRRQMPIIDRVADRFEGRATVAVVNAQEVPSVAVAHDIRAVPTLILFKDGQVVWKKVGLHKEDQLAAVLEQYAPAAGPVAAPGPDGSSA